MTPDLDAPGGVVASAIVIAAVAVLIRANRREPPVRRIVRTEAEAERGDWQASLAAWRAANRNSSADARSLDG